MRNLFLALVVANIAFFVWARWIDVPAPPRPAVSRSPSIPRLELAPAIPLAGASESAAAVASPAGPAAAAAPAAPTAPNAPAGAAAPGAGPSGAAASTTPPVDTASAGRCRTVGPFEDVDIAHAAATRLRAQGFDPRDRSANVANPNVYWVYIGELTQAAQRSPIQSLSSAGIHDAASMTQPEQSDRLSVGVFADQAHAVKRAEQVRALGFKPTLGIRQRRVQVHWLDFELGGTDAEPKAAELLRGVPRSPSSLGAVKVIDCPAGSGSG